MIQFFRKLFEMWSCKHDYQLISRMNVWTDDSIKTGLPHKVTCHYKCTKCGKFTKWELT